MDTRILALDIGDKRIGVAYSDPFLEYATPSDTYFRTGDFARDLNAIVHLIETQMVTHVVCGLPLNADGSESVQTEKTRRFVEALKERISQPVFLEDERYTTREARRDLVSMGVSTQKDKKKKQIDSIAAAYILEGYLAKLKKEQKEMDYKEEENNYEEDDNIVELVDEEGNSYRYEHLMTFEYKGEWYCALTPEAVSEEAEDDEEGEEVAIYHIVGEENDEHLEAIEDEQFLDEVFAEFCNQYDDFEDADEAASLDGDDGEGDK